MGGLAYYTLFFALVANLSFVASQSTRSFCNYCVCTIDVVECVEALPPPDVFDANAVKEGNFTLYIFNSALKFQYEFYQNQIKRLFFAVITHFKTSTNPNWFSKRSTTPSIQEILITKKTSIVSTPHKTTLVPTQQPTLLIGENHSTSLTTFLPMMTTPDDDLPPLNKSATSIDRTAHKSLDWVHTLMFILCGFMLIIIIGLIVSRLMRRDTNHISHRRQPLRLPPLNISNPIYTPVNQRHSIEEFELEATHYETPADIV